VDVAMRIHMEHELLDLHRLEAHPHMFGRLLNPRKEGLLALERIGYWVLRVELGAQPLKPQSSFLSNPIILQVSPVLRPT
jgi:hypothetical protein